MKFSKCQIIPIFRLPAYSVHNFLQDSHTQCGRVLLRTVVSLRVGQLYLAVTTKMIFMIRRHWHDGFRVVLVSRCDTTTRGLLRVSSAARQKMSTYAERPSNSWDIKWIFSIEHTLPTLASMNEFPYYATIFFAQLDNWLLHLKVKYRLYVNLNIAKIGNSS